MAIRKKRAIEQGLLRKGFQQDPKKHQIFRLVIDGKISGIKTWTSHGSDDDLGEDLIHGMKKELKLQTKDQFLRLIDCPMSHAEYVIYLRNQGFQL